MYSRDTPPPHILFSSLSFPLAVPYLFLTRRLACHMSALCVCPSLYFALPSASSPISFLPLALSSLSSHVAPVQATLHFSSIFKFLLLLLSLPLFFWGLSLPMRSLHCFSVCVSPCLYVLLPCVCGSRCLPGVAEKRGNTTLPLWFPGHAGCSFPCHASMYPKGTPSVLSPFGNVTQFVHDRLPFFDRLGRVNLS